jgi:flagellar protein FlaF
MYKSAREAYSTGGKTTTSSRQLEAQALSRAAQRLEDGRDGTGPDGASQLHAALRHNLKLWTFFQAELVRPNHGMEMDLRKALLELSLFVDKHTYELLAAPERSRVQPLIDINRQLAAGLTVTIGSPAPAALG